MKSVDLDILIRQCRTVLGREVERLMDASHKGKLSRDDTATLVNYFKLLPDLKKQEKEALGELTDEQLEVLAKETE